MQWISMNFRHFSEMPWIKFQHFQKMSEIHCIKNARKGTYIRGHFIKKHDSKVSISTRIHIHYLVMQFMFCIHVHFTNEFLKSFLFTLNVVNAFTIFPQLPLYVYSECNSMYTRWRATDFFLLSELNFNAFLYHDPKTILDFTLLYL